MNGAPINPRTNGELVSTAENQIDRPLRAEPVKSLKEQFKSVPRGTPVSVDMRRFPNAPQNVFVRPPPGTKIAAWEQSGVEYGRRGKVKIKHSPTRKAELIVLCVCDENGNLVWTESQTDIREVAGMDAPLVNHLFSAARKAAGQEIEDDDEDEDDAEGN